MRSKTEDENHAVRRLTRALEKIADYRDGTYQTPSSWTKKTNKDEAIRHLEQQLASWNQVYRDVAKIAEDALKRNVAAGGKADDGFAAADGEKVRTAPIKSGWNIPDSDEMLLYRGANGEALSLATTAKEMLLNSIIPYRKRAIRAERRLEAARTEMIEKLNRVKELEKLDFEESYGKPNNYGGLKGFVISPVNISSIDVIHDNDAALVWFGDRRIAPRLRDWLEDHRDVLPKDAKNIKPGRKPVDVDARCVKLANGMMVSKGDVIWISVMDKRRSVQMKVTGFGRWPDGEYNIRGMAPRRDGVSRTLSGGPSDTLSVVHERRVIG